MRFRISVKELHLDVEALSASVKEAARRLLREAAREYLRTAGPLIPQSTSRAKMSLAPLAKMLHVGWHIASTQEARTFLGRHPTLGSLSSRRQEGMSSTKLSGGSDDPIVQNRTRYSLHISTGLEYFDSLTLRKASTSMLKYFKLEDTGPWQALNLGAIAANKYIMRRGPEVFAEMYNFKKSAKFLYVKKVDII